MLKGDHSFQRRQETILASPIKSSQRPRWWRRNWFYATLITLAIVGVFCAFFLPPLIPGINSEGETADSLRKAILAVLAGSLTMLTLSETHRKNNQEKEKNERDHIRQVYAERRSRYIKAVEQLANDKAAVRLGGIYTLVGLVDEWLADDTLDPEERQKEGQVIINNLCSYIRSPFPLAEEIEEYEAHKELEKLQKSESEKLRETESSQLQILLKRFEDSGEYENPKDITTDYAKFREEQDVRRAIFVEMGKRSSVISNKEEGDVTVIPGTWSDFDFDFSRAPIFYPLNNLTIEKANFSLGRFYGEISFLKTTFVRKADFCEAVFIQHADFAGTTFIQHADFTGTTFTQHADFTETIFTQEVRFGKATFIQTADFRVAVFTQNARFRMSTFAQEVRFGEATFTQNADFSLTTFTQGVSFRKTTFTQKAVFRSATFAQNTNFNDSYFKKYAPTFAEGSDAARFSNRVIWADSNFSVRSGSQPIKPGDATLDGKTFRIPIGAVIFNPDSWDEEIKKYTHISDPAK